MASSARPSTPPSTHSRAPDAGNQLTPEQEESRLKAKALRSRQDADALASGAVQPLRTPSGFVVAPTAGQKRGSDGRPAPTQRDGTEAQEASATKAKRDNEVLAARKFAKYVDYDLSKMTDTKGGFMTADDDPHNRALHAPASGETRPAHMSVAEWERLQTLRRLRKNRSGLFEPGLSALDSAEGGAAAAAKNGCAECGALELDWQLLEVFGVRVCAKDRDALPDKYSLLTKTEAKEDYLLTDPELRDPELLPRLEKPNPHKREWNNMHLFLRCQVEEYAFGRKWGSQAALDAEYERRQADKRRRKEDKFRSKLAELKKRTRVEAYRRARGGGAASTSGPAQFGDAIRSRGDVHEHDWGLAVTDPSTGTATRTCATCGMEVEELEF